MAQQLRTLFLADDDDEDCIIFLEALQELNYQDEIVVSRDGEQLMMNLNKKVPSLPFVIFLDLNMPFRDGFSCLKEIKTIDKLKQIPIVVLSTSSEIKNISLAYNLGANYYMPKPATFAQLVSGIGKVLRLDLSHQASTSKQEFILQSS